MASSSRNTPSLATRSVHADDPINHITDVAPPIHVSSTFRYTEDPSKLQPESEIDPATHFAAPGGAIKPDAHIYSRLTAPNTSRLETLLSSLLGAPCLTYGSGLAAFHALLTWLNPKVVAIGAGYHGCHGVLKIYQKLTKCKIVDLFDESTWGELGEGDVVHLETPLNPTGKAFNVQYFADMAHKRGAVLTVDATFAPPPLLDPFKFGADFVMHSGTKYFGGHSDMLCGVIAVKPGKEKDYWGMFNERVFLGSVMGSLEGWLGVRSLRTLELRVMRQSENATKLVQWISESLEKGEDFGVVQKLEHASLQKEDMGWLKEQMPNGYGPVFSLWMKTEELAKCLPSKLNFFHHATSLGGVESLIEWRRMSDDTVEGTLLRVSVGIESWEDLKTDFLEGFKALAAEKK